MLDAAPSQDLTPAQEALIRVRAGYAPPPKELCSEFSDNHIIVTSGPLSGTRWQTSFAPFQRGILDVWHEPGVNTVIVMGSSQWGKTSILINQCGYRIARDPAAMMIVFPTVEPMARDFAKNRLEPTIEATEVLRETVSKKRSKDASNTALLKKFRRGFLVIAGANSAASLAARTIRDLWGDEIDRWPRELPGEGNTLSIALKRTQAFGRRARRFLTSSPTIVDGPIHAWFKRGDQRRYYVPCPQCTEMHTYEWANVKWTDDDPATAHLVCPHCEYEISEAERIAVLHKGEWRAERPDRQDRSIVSFHLWEAYSPLSSLAEIVRNFLAAREKQKAGDKSEMHTWQNTTLAEPIEPEKSDGPDAHVLLQRREAFLSDSIDVPEGACCLVAGIDTQDMWLEAHVWAYGPGEESWLVDYHRFDGDTERPEPWARLDAVLERQYRHPTGHRLMIQSACIDTAGHRTTVVYDWVERKGVDRIKAVVGRDKQRPFIAPPSMQKIRGTHRTVPLYIIGIDTGKSILASRLKITEHGPGYIHLPVADWCNQEYAEQLTSEYEVTKWERGVPRKVWKRRRPRNEALDCYGYALGALRHLNPKLHQMLDILRSTAPRRPTGGPSTPSGGTGRRVARSNYLDRD
jgi:phage terminase large subunit GpA-like protein